MIESHESDIEKVFTFNDRDILGVNENNVKSMGKKNNTISKRHIEGISRYL